MSPKTYPRKSLSVTWEVEKGTCVGRCGFEYDALLPVEVGGGLLLEPTGDPDRTRPTTHPVPTSLGNGSTSW